jgi:hypothetical protein
VTSVVPLAANRKPTIPLGTFLGTVNKVSG